MISLFLVSPGALRYSKRLTHLQSKAICGRPKRMPFKPWLKLAYPLLLVASALPAFSDDVYRTVDAQGHVTYSDKPLTSTSKKVAVDVIAANPQEAARLAKERALVNADAAQQSKLAAQQASEQQQQQSQDAAQRRRCDAARARYSLFAAGGRIFKMDDQGNRAFYSDEEIEAQKTASKAAVDSLCLQ
jgi:hypothetical protein